MFIDGTLFEAALTNFPEDAVTAYREIKCLAQQTQQIHKRKYTNDSESSNLCTCDVASVPIRERFELS